MIPPKNYWKIAFPGNARNRTGKLDPGIQTQTAVLQTGSATATRFPGHSPASSLNHPPWNLFVIKTSKNGSDNKEM